MSWPSMAWRSALRKLQRLSNTVLVPKYPPCGPTNMPADFWTLSQSVSSDQQPPCSPHPYHHPPDVLLWPLLCQWLLYWWQSHWYPQLVVASLVSITRSITNLATCTSFRTFIHLHDLRAGWRCQRSAKHRVQCVRISRLGSSPWCSVLKISASFFTSILAAVSVLEWGDVARDRTTGKMYLFDANRFVLQ